MNLNTPTAATTHIVDPKLFLPMHQIISTLVESRFALCSLCVCWSALDRNGQKEDGRASSIRHTFGSHGDQPGLIKYTSMQGTEMIWKTADPMLHVIESFCNHSLKLHQVEGEGGARPKDLTWRFAVSLGDQDQLRCLRTFMRSLHISGLDFWDGISVSVVWSRPLGPSEQAMYTTNNNDNKHNKNNNNSNDTRTNNNNIDSRARKHEDGEVAWVSNGAASEAAVLSAFDNVVVRYTQRKVMDPDPHRKYAITVQGRICHASFMRHWHDHQAFRTQFLPELEELFSWHTYSF